MNNVRARLVSVHLIPTSESFKERFPSYFILRLIKLQKFGIGLGPRAQTQLISTHKYYIEFKIKLFILTTA